jgi:signal transduction histidine kinase
MRAPPADARDRLRDFARAATDWSWEVDADLRIVALSEGAAAIASQPYMFMIGEPLAALGRLAEGPDGELPIRRAQREQSSVRAQLLDAGGQRYRLDGAPLFDGGRFSGFRGVARLADGAPAELSSERLVATMSHELRTPLTAIIGFAEAMTLGTHGPLQPHYVDYARDIAAAGRHLMSMLDDLLDVAPEVAEEARLEVAPFDMVGALDQAKSMIALRAASRRIAIEGPLEPGPLQVLADRRRVLQILVNLLTNAVKFTPEGGRVAIDLGSDGTLATVTIADTGPGIAPGDRERVFGKFARGDGVEAEGSGLGLHISRELARRMNGELRLDSAPAPGARFTLELPAA